MAKDKYTISTNVDIIGRLDYNQQDELVVYIEKGKGDNMIVVEVPLMDILQSYVRTFSWNATVSRNAC